MEAKALIRKQALQIRDRMPKGEHSIKSQQIMQSGYVSMNDIGCRCYSCLYLISKRSGYRDGNSQCMGKWKKGILPEGAWNRNGIL